MAQAQWLRLSGGATHVYPLRWEKHPFAVTAATCRGGTAHVYLLGERTVVTVFFFALQKHDNVKLCGVPCILDFIMDDSTSGTGPMAQAQRRNNTRLSPAVGKASLYSNSGNMPGGHSTCVSPRGENARVSPLVEFIGGYLFFPRSNNGNKTNFVRSKPTLCFSCYRYH